MRILEDSVETLMGTFVTFCDMHPPGTFTRILGRDLILEAKEDVEPYRSWGSKPHQHLLIEQKLR